MADIHYITYTKSKKVLLGDSSNVLVSMAMTVDYSQDSEPINHDLAWSQINKELEAQIAEEVMGAPKKKTEPIEKPEKKSTSQEINKPEKTEALQKPEKKEEKPAISQHTGLFKPGS